MKRLISIRSFYYLVLKKREKRSHTQMTALKGTTVINLLFSIKCACLKESPRSKKTVEHHRHTHTYTSQQRRRKNNKHCTTRRPEWRRRTKCEEMKKKKTKNKNTKKHWNCEASDMNKLFILPQNQNDIFRCRSKRIVVFRNSFLDYI